MKFSLVVVVVGIVLLGLCSSSQMVEGSMPKFPRNFVAKATYNIDAEGSKRYIYISYDGANNRTYYVANTKPESGETIDKTMTWGLGEYYNDVEAQLRFVWSKDPEREVLDCEVDQVQGDEYLDMFFLNQPCSQKNMGREKIKKRSTDHWKVECSGISAEINYYWDGSDIVRIVLSYPDTFPVTYNFYDFTKKADYTKYIAPSNCIGCLNGSGALKKKEVREVSSNIKKPIWFRN